MEDYLTEDAKCIIKKAIGNPYLTNCFLYYKDVLDMVDSKIIHVKCMEDIVVLVHEIGDIHKMYYCLKSVNVWIEKIRRELNRELSVYPHLEAELVIRDGFRMPNVLEKLKFRFYKEYVRKQLIVQPGFVCKETKFVETANTADEDCIYELLYKTFDIMSDQLVSRKELSALIKSGQVLIVKKRENMAGVLLFETHGKKSYLRALCVDSNYTGQRVGVSLMANYIKRNIQYVKMFYLWVESTNEPAKRLYEKLGYQDDGLKNYIYLYNGTY